MDEWTHVQHMFSTVRQQIARRQAEQQQHRQEIEQLRTQQQQRDTGTLRALPPSRPSSDRLQQWIEHVDSLARQAEQQEREDPGELRRQQAWLESKKRLQAQIMQKDQATGAIQRRLSHLLANTQPIEERATERIPVVRRTTTQPLWHRPNRSA